jgi:hypothetical protein
MNRIMDRKYLATAKQIRTLFSLGIKLSSPGQYHVGALGEILRRCVSCVRYDLAADEYEKNPWRVVVFEGKLDSDSAFAESFLTEAQARAGLLIFLLRNGYVLPSGKILREPIDIYHYEG